MKKPDTNQLIELARDIYTSCTFIDLTTRREKVVGAMAHLVPTGCLVLVPSVVDTVIEQESLASKK